jgi:hypothetical protein
MAQTVPLTVRLGAANTGLALGYRILNLDRTTYSAFTTTGVVESTVLGTYSVDDGAIAPDAGGYVVWGTSGNDRLEGNIDPVPAGLATLATSIETIDNFLDTEIATIITNLATVDTVVDGIATDVDALSTSSSITVVSAVDGDDITVYQSDTWSFSHTVGAGVVLTDYEAVAFVVKTSTGIADASGTLYLRSDTGLVAIGGAAPVSASNGVLTIDSATAYTVLVHMAETNVTAGRYTWWLKGLDLSATPDRGRTIATGKFMIRAHGVRAII